MLVSLPSWALNRVCTEHGTPTGAVVVHVNARIPSPVAVHVNSIALPLATVTLCGGIVIVGGSTEWEVQNMEVDLLVITMMRSVLYFPLENTASEIVLHRFCNKPVKVPLTLVQYGKYSHGSGLKVIVTLGFASCYISLSTTHFCNISRSALAAVL